MREIKERPIIFSTEMVRAILDGRKTMTRRVVKLRRITHNPTSSLSAHGGIYSMADMSAELELAKNIKPELPCPYGQVGDRLWVRETFAVRADGVYQILYKSDYEEVVKMLELHEFTKRMGLPPLDIKWKPSIHMFRKDSRILLEITALRVERLQEITLNDCKAEGIGQYTFAMGCCSENPPDARWKFIELWDSLNATRGFGWDKNPWVWAIGFKPLEAGD